jgi:hypothetical protein
MLHGMKRGNRIGYAKWKGVWKKAIAACMNVLYRHIPGESEEELEYPQRIDLQSIASSVSPGYKSYARRS